ncbi:hypothetical protein V6N13_114281 [Hibiscus sabdariffa]
MTHPTVLRLVEEFTEASTLRLQVEVGEGCHMFDDVHDLCATIGLRAKLGLVRGGVFVDECLARASSGLGGSTPKMYGRRFEGRIEVSLVVSQEPFGWT